MRYDLYVIAFIVAALAMLALSKCEAAECLPSARAVWAAHDGAHATWSAIDGRKCWFSGFPERKRGGAIGERLQNRMVPRHLNVALSAAVPLPRARPELEVLHPERYPRVTAEQGMALAIELLPTPTQQELTRLLMAVGRWK